ncbi:hypothetical protein Lxx20540 [Leifsonia xyli subsp. xyli str. CTCB07]|uniref:Uncharacterized protein n=1 Tax=Leifsonia xyli subsp. xyli (strain CTCB07) TaxID=281090 RepID=Q6ACY0_LEIXX|nr:hypothetical protein Lxx20540 [Leifsonia xyli subsp. xyli str. CTCB07]
MIFDNTASDDGFVKSRPSGVWFDSSRLPMTRTSQIGAHQHMNWAFTAPGRYCLNVTAKTQLTSGSWASDSGMVTVWIGDPAAAGYVVPCDRDATPPQASLQPLAVTPTATARVARAGGADLTTYLTGGRHRHGHPGVSVRDGAGRIRRRGGCRLNRQRVHYGRLPHGAGHEHRAEHRPDRP